MAKGAFRQVALGLRFFEIASSHLHLLSTFMCEVGKREGGETATGARAATTTDDEDGNDDTAGREEEGGEVLLT